MATNRMNIIFCFTDQQKATSLDLYNKTFSAIAARNLRRLAERGTVFNNAYCASPLCVPSRIAMMTGRYPTTSGHIANGPMLDPEADSLPDRLKAAGYITYLAGKDHCFAKGKASSRDKLPGITRRYDHAFLAIHNDYQPPEITEALPDFMPFIEGSRACHTIWGAEITPWSREGTLTKILTDKALDFMEEHGRAHPEKPFFLHWGPPDPHEYYQVPREYAEMFPPEEIVLPPNWRADLTDKAEFVQFMKWYFTVGDPSPTEAEIRKLISVYLGMCALVDDELGRLIDYVEAKGMADRTIFVFSSDHGDMCGELGLAHKWNGLYEAMVRVPLVISAPRPDIPAGRRVEAPVSLVDLAATLCELVGAEVPSGNQGKSLVDLMQGKSDREYVFMESGVPGRALTLEDTRHFPDYRWDNAAYASCPYDPPHRWTGKCLAVRDGRYKLILREGQRSELYDLKEDSGEVCNLIDDPDLLGVVSRLQAALLDHVSQILPNHLGCFGHNELDPRYRPGSGQIFHGPVHPAWPLKS